MSILKKTNCLFAIVSLSTIFSLSSCLTSSKMDRFVAAQYNNQLPKQDKKKQPTITVASSMPATATDISKTVQKTSKVLPLIVYWQYDYRHTCTLNPSIAVNNFSNAINTIANKGLNQKLAGRKLELMVEQAPTAFAIVDKGHIIWLIYAFGWENVYVEPDFKDLIVSYKVTGEGSEEKAGKIAIKNSAQSKGIRYFQSWKSATAEHLTDHEARMAAMTKSFVSKLMEEL